MSRSTRALSTGKTPISDPRYIVQSELTALSHGNISEAVDQFDDCFAFNDQALGLNFTDKRRLREFFQKSRNLFPDSVLKVISTFECGDHVVAEWKLTATEAVPYYKPLRVPISLPGVSIAQIENGRISRWSDYYDGITSRRVTLAAFFTDWMDY